MLGTWGGNSRGAGGTAPRGGLYGVPGGYCCAKAKLELDCADEEQAMTNLKRFVSLFTSLPRTGCAAQLLLQSCHSKGALHHPAYGLCDVGLVLLPAFGHVMVS